MLKRVLDTKQIVIYPSPNESKDAFSSDSVRLLHTAVACPILDIGEGGNEIIGVLYADRELNMGRQSGVVMEAEQKLIAILATAIASSIARRKREALVTKYQQFFSPKVTEAISRRTAFLAASISEWAFAKVRPESETRALSRNSSMGRWAER